MRVSHKDRPASGALTRFARNQRGAVALVMGLVLIPIIGIVGATVDYSRASSVKNELQHALDASVLSVAHHSGINEQEAAAHIRESVLAMLGTRHGVQNLSVEVQLGVDGNLIVSDASLNIDTAMLQLMGVDTIEVGAFSAVSAEYSALEVALVLDNTRSMRRHMRSLRTAAQDFVDIVTEDGRNDQTFVSLVPYVASVNIGSAEAHESYLDVDGRAQWHARLSEWQWFGKYDWCSWPSNDGDSGPNWDNSGGDGASLDEPVHSPLLDMLQTRLALIPDALSELIGVSPAHAYEPYTHRLVDDCYIANPGQISHWQLFDQVDLDWKGCVEARPEPFDVLDTAPDRRNPDTLWVPYFWWDENDDFASWAPDAVNDWINDGPFVPDTSTRNSSWGRTHSVLKYTDTNTMRIDETPPRTSGPNKACGDPILPLTNNYRQLSERISDMTYWDGGGTVTAQGVVWGWRALSPTPPFTEGLPYADVTKVMVVMTDGANILGRSDIDATLSHYSAYGHLRMGRMGNSMNSARAYIDERTLQACRNAKDAGVVVYTVTFGLNDRDARRLWDDCATETSMAFHVGTASELVGAFNFIAGAVGELRLTR